MVRASAGVAERRGAPLRSEHVYPLNLLSRDLATAELTVEAFGRIVADRLVLAVVTVAEDDRLAAAGLSRSMPAAWDGRDPFDRYRAAGLNVDAFAPRRDACIPEGTGADPPAAPAARPPEQLTVAPGDSPQP